MNTTIEDVKQYFDQFGKVSRLCYSDFTMGKLCSYRLGKRNMTNTIKYMIIISNAH